MKTAQETVKERYPDAECVRTEFGIGIRESENGKIIAQVRTAGYPEEAWVLAAETLEGLKVVR